ncbi:hypothetical protein [Streptomyces sp. NPDC050560]|uniref:hypothetical protein n=1 Tax=Streptomyces sp. NPDC050560 TaxID=3365630 RepID=UPI0037A43F34
MTTANDRPNPFHVLGLPVDADQQTVVEQAEEGMQTAASAQERELYDWAMRELIKHPHTRLGHELTEPRPTDYRDRRRDAFVRRNRGNPAKLPGHRLGPEDFDLPEAVRRTVRELIEATPAGGLATLPVTSGDTEPELEVRDVLF